MEIIIFRHLLFFSNVIAVAVIVIVIIDIINGLLPSLSLSSFIEGRLGVVAIKLAVSSA